MREKTIAWAVLIFSIIGLEIHSQEKEPLWVFPVGASIQSSPAIGQDGTIYFGADNGIFYALTPQGKKKWEFVTSGLIVSSPAIASDGTIYITSIDKIVYAINPDGSEKWRIMPGSGIVSSPAIAPDGTIVVGTVFNKLFAISADGFRKWEFPTMGNIISSAAIDREGTIYFGCMDTNFYAVSTNGAALWSFTAGDKINSSPAIDTDGTLYFGSFDKSVYSLAPSGKLRWNFKTEGAVRSSPVIGADGVIYIGSDDKKIYAIGHDGLKRWDFETRDVVRSTPAIDSDGTIYVGSYDGNLYAINKDGSLKWILKTQGIVSSSPIIDTNGVLYFGSWDRNFYAVKIDKPLASSPWPCFRKNIRRSGCEIDDVLHATTTKPIAKTEQELRVPSKKIDQNVEESNSLVSALPPTSAVKEQKPQQPKAEKTKPEQENPLEKPLAPETVLTPAEKPSEAIKKSSQKPSIKITSPKDGARVEDAKIVVEGTAKDKNGVKSVQYRLNSVKMGTAQGLGKWSVPLILQEGKNIFEARCENVDGNFSEWEKITIFYKPSFKIFAEILGKGKITPDVSGKKYESGSKIKLKAEPGKDYRFLTWFGSISDTSPEIEILVLSNIAVKAIFVPAEKHTTEPIHVTEKPSTEIQKPAKPQSISGSYRALLYPKSDDEIEVHGMLHIIVNSDSTWKGTLTTVDENISCEGKFDKENYSFVTIKRGTEMPVGIALKLSETNDNYVLNGHLTGLGKEMILSGHPQIALSQDKNIKQGLYTSIIAVPQKEELPPAGDGYAKLLLDEKGNVQINGKLYDNTQFSATSGLQANLTIPIFTSIKNGFLAGVLMLTNTPMSDLAGTMLWIKFANNTEKKIEKTNLRVVGSHFSPQIASRFISDTNLIIAFNGGGLDSLVPNMVYITPENKIEIKYTEVGMEFSFDFETGFYKGSFIHPIFKKQAHFDGVFLQKAKWGSGHFSCENKTGIVLVVTDSEEAK